MKHYGIFLGRCQPFHAGHQHIIDKIISDGLEPIVILGSAQESRTANNPYNEFERLKMVQLVYPNVQVILLDDADCWDDWHNALLCSIQSFVTTNLDEVTIYLHDKLEDLQDFTFRGKDYLNESYSKVYEVDGMHTTKLPISDIQIRAKSIRADLEGNKEFLHPAVYNYIKALND